MISQDDVTVYNIKEIKTTTTYGAEKRVASGVGVIKAPDVGRRVVGVHRLAGEKRRHDPWEGFVSDESRRS
jgi:hypothetical protein